MEDGIVIDAKIQKVNNVARDVVYIKHTLAGVYMIWYRSCIVCTLLVYISSFKLFLVWMLYKFCTVCTFFVYI